MRDGLVTLLGAACFLAGPVVAQGAGEGDFTFKKIAPPTPGATRRITVQVDPLAAARAMAAVKAERAAQEALAAAEAEAIAALPVGPYDWFWTEVSAKLEDAGPANVSRALSTLNTDTTLTPPRLQNLQDIAQAFGPAILMSTIGTNISPALVLALISVESSGKAGAESPKGAQGLMQLIPETAARFGVEDSSDPVQNIQGGVAYLTWLLDHFDGDPILALAGYNAGEGAVTKHGGVPPYDETRGYVPKVLNAWRVARGLCMTPPELLTDGCVFAVNGTISNG